MILRLERVVRRFGSVTAVDEVSLALPYGCRQAIIGPNGAGKSTLFGLIAGATKPDSGRVIVDGHDVTRLPEHQRVRQGVARVFQRPAIFPALTVADNVALADHGRAGVAGHLAEAGLTCRSADAAGILSYGEQRRLEIVMALATRPRLLLLDEPSAGLSSAETAELATLLESLPISIVIIEHDLDLVFNVATQVCVLHLGRVLASGTPRDIGASPAVREAYLP